MDQSKVRALPVKVFRHSASDTIELLACLSGEYLQVLQSNLQHLPTAHR